MNIQRYIGFWAGLLAVAVLPVAKQHLCHCSISDFSLKSKVSEQSDSCCSGRQSSESSSYSVNCCCAMSCTQTCCDWLVSPLNFEPPAIHPTALDLQMLPALGTLEIEFPSVISVLPYCNASIQERICQLNC